MQVSHQLQLTKGSYFYTEVGLYYVELVIDEDYLVENCLTYDHSWLKIEDLEMIDYTAVSYEEVVSD